MTLKRVHTHYDNLKVPRNATPQQISAAYRRLAKKYHPDRNPGDAEATKVMALINVSYGVLSDPVKRRAHDEWIRSEEGADKAQKEEKSKKKRNSPADPLPMAGSCRIASLSQDSLNYLQDVIGGRNGVSIRTVSPSYSWMAVGLTAFWFFLLLINQNTHWIASEIIMSLAAALWMSYSISRLYLWNYALLHGWFVLTPLYVIYSESEVVRYWPLWEIKDMRFSKKTSYSMFDGLSAKFVFSADTVHLDLFDKMAEDKLREAFSHYTEMMRKATENDLAEYVKRHDVFSTLNRSARPGSKILHHRNMVFLATLTLCVLIFFVTMPSMKDYSNTETQGTSSYLRRHGVYDRKSKEPEYHRPSMAPNGIAWPSKAGYLSGYMVLDADGYSRVNVDNSNNVSDVFVLLENTTSHQTARTLFIHAGGDFTIRNLSPGQYELRYQDLDSGMFYQSESFRLIVEKDVSGTRYVDYTIRLVKNPAESRQIRRITKKEFYR